MFFAPELSTSNRATIGGMISTDASGQGSCEYGKTRDHVLELDVVLHGARACTASRWRKRHSPPPAPATTLSAGSTVKPGRWPPSGRADRGQVPAAQPLPHGYDLAHLIDARGTATSTACCAAPRVRSPCSTRRPSTCCRCPRTRPWSTCATPASWTPARRQGADERGFAGSAAAAATDLDRDGRRQGTDAGDGRLRLGQRGRVLPR
nr:FAD-binding protein [Salinicola tamaricis]